MYMYIFLSTADSYRIGKTIQVYLYTCNIRKIIELKNFELTTPVFAKYTYSYLLYARPVSPRKVVSQQWRAVIG